MWTATWALNTLDVSEALTELCGTKAGEGEFEPYQQMMQCIYGPRPVSRTHTCEKCGYSWTTCAMLDMDSFDVVRQICSVPENGKPIVIMTAYDWANLEKEARSAGVAGFISKPLFLSELRDALARALGVVPNVPKKDVEETFDFTGKRILLVEDNELNREIAQSVLESMGFGVDSAKDGSVAINLLKGVKPGLYDLILMDMQMPVMDGLEASRQIRAMGSEYLSNIPIIAMTANAFEEDRKAALDVGMNEHIAKPIDMEKLERVLKKFLG